MTSMNLPMPINSSAKKLISLPPEVNKCSQALLSTSIVPPYGNRKGFIPRKESDFGDGGSFPEIHVAQYPLSMGIKKSTSSNNDTLTMHVDERGKVKYDQIARQGHSEDRIVYSKLTDILQKNVDDSELERPTEEEIIQEADKTKSILDGIVSKKVAAAAPVRKAEKLAPVQYIRYTPSQQDGSFNSGASQRIVRMCEAPVDPMEPPRFSINTKIPRGPPSPPAPIMHSPNRKLTQKDHIEWKIPSCISNWKNPRGHTIPLDKRVAADGRGLQKVHINEKFSKLAEALQIADRKAREAVEMRAQTEKKMMQIEKEKKEKELLKIAQQAREDAANANKRADPVGTQGERERDEIRRERAKDRTRSRNIARSTKDGNKRERDISEQIALGMPTINAATTGVEAQFDQRLFNQSKGLDSGFAGGEDEIYNIYDKPWQTDKTAASNIYRPTKEKDVGANAGPVEFEEDIFNLKELFSSAKKAKKE